MGSVPQSDSSRRFGVCVFAGVEEHPLAEALPYLDAALLRGATLVMTSLHLPEMDLRRAADECRQIAERTRAANAMFLADVSPRALDMLGATPADLSTLASMGLDGVRPDYGFSPADLAAIALGRQLALVLNATDTEERVLATLADRGCALAGTWAFHNYYPRPETGIDLATVIQRGAVLRRHGLQIAAFAASHGRRRGPVFGGLPSVEDLREIPCAAAAEVLFATHAVDAVLLGDPSLDIAETDRLASVSEREVVQIRAERDGTASRQEQEVMEAVHRCWSVAPYLVRTGNPAARSPAPAIPRRNTVDRPAYSITIDNDQYSRFAGTLHVTRRALPADDRVNRVGRVRPADRILVDLLQPGDRFQFVWMG